ncbi:hypothetical protein ABZ845_04345 [Streptomyces sp. NPDC047022]|uniref:hypothetical protein n=1 Tax=Streptomyces sp. NPDC047022 TaxID=3155737 RepID=UPI0033D0C52A
MALASDTLTDSFALAKMTPSPALTVPVMVPVTVTPRVRVIPMVSSFVPSTLLTMSLYR